MDTCFEIRAVFIAWTHVLFLSMIRVRFVSNYKNIIFFIITLEIKKLILDISLEIKLKQYRKFKKNLSIYYYLTINTFIA